MTYGEYYSWLMRHTDWRPDLPVAERSAIEDCYDQDAVALACANGFN